MHDGDPKKRDLTYYGVIKDIIKLSFDNGRRKIVLFECDWTDNNKIKIDKYGFTLVDFTRPNKKTCPFILPSLVMQAFFVPDPCNKPWVVPIVTKSRKTYNLGTEGECLELMAIRTDPNTTTQDAEHMEE